MRTVSLEELLEAGCHFGHQVSRQNSKARDYIFEARDKIHIIDLEKTKEGLEDAAKFIKEVGKKNGTLLVLGTKRQAANIIEQERKRLQSESIDGVYFVTKRWIGGTLTNFAEVAKNYKKLQDITEKLQDPKARAKYTKKELNDWEKTRQKLEGFYGGIALMPAAPTAMFIIDTHLEHVAANEALKAGVKTVGITDTNADPTIISYPIPANDDAVGSLQLISAYIFDAWIEGKKQGKIDAEQAKEQEEKVAKVEAKKQEATEEKKKTAKVEDKVKEENAEAKKKETASPKKTAAKKTGTEKKEK